MRGVAEIPLRLWVWVFAAAGLVPLFWTFGGALLARSGELFAMASSAAVWSALGRSVALGAMAAAGAFALAAPLAFLTGRTAIPGRRVLSALALAPLALPPYLIALGLGGRLPSSPAIASGLAAALALYPVPFIFLRVGLANLDPALEEAGVLARGIGPTLWRITGPLVAPWAASSLGLVFLLGLGELGAPALLGWNVYPSFILLRFAATYDAGGAAVAAVPLLAVALLVLGLETRALRRAEAFASRLRPPRLLALGWGRYPASFLCLAIVFVSPGLPLFALAAKVDQAGIGALPALAAGPAMNSAMVSLAGCALALGTAFSFALLTRAGRRAHRILPLTFFVLPGAILGVALIGFWNRPALPPLYGTMALVVLALVLRYTVLVELSAEAGLRNVPRSQEEAALLAGRSEWAIRMRILAPQIGAPFLAGGAAFVLFALRDLDTVVTIYPPGRETLLVRLYTVLANSPEGLQAALTMVQVALTLPLVLIVIVMARRSRWLL